MTSDLEEIYNRLFSYSKSRNFAGHDPFDGLNSVLFHLTPLKHIRAARLAWLQMIKRSPVDLRPVLRVPEGVNPKGLALFVLAEISRFRATNAPQHAENAKDLVTRLLDTKINGRTSDGRPTTAFGYNFDWQSRAFFVGRGTPAIVPTAFVSQAVIEAYQAFGDEQYLDAAEEICTFILTDLNRVVESDDEICFSYTPVDTSIIYNASLLAGESLARVGAITGTGEYLEMAAKTARYVIRRQHTAGDWAYGADAKHAWVDNFHTAYVLLSLFRISGAVESLRSESFDAIRNGVDHWLDKFFLADGAPKYYDNGVYPIDIHSAAVAIAALSELSPIDERMLPMARKTAEWTIANMLDPQGYFYYQIRERRVIKTPFMRWGQAWMAYALARLAEAERVRNS